MDTLLYDSDDVAISVTAGSAFSAKLPTLGDTPWSLYDVVFCPEAATADDGTNYAQIRVLAPDGSTVLAEWSTETGQEGALSDGVPVKLPFSGQAGSVAYGAEHEKVSGNSTPSCFRVAVVHAGTGAAISGRLKVVKKRSMRTEAVSA